MTILQAIVLGLVQGITEFLPISSSAHLILVPHVFGWPDAGLRFAVVTNAGTLLAAVVYFRKTLANVLRSPARSLLARWSRPTVVRGALIGSIPVIAVGLAFHDFLSGAARSLPVIAATTIGFGLLLAWADRVGARHRDLRTLGWCDVATIGLAQALALVPGTSRSGVTMTAGLALGLTRPAAARFAFLLAIPVGVMALAKDFYDLVSGTAFVGAESAGVTPTVLLVGFPVAAISAYAVIDVLLRVVERTTLNLFVVYRLALGFLLVMVMLRS